MYTVSLFVRLWVEIGYGQKFNYIWGGSASSWGCELKWRGSYGTYHDQSSASSWGCELKFPTIRIILACFQSASSWGCELKFRSADRDDCVREVSLFVRLWVEIEQIRLYTVWMMSASSWGCELKYLLHILFYYIQIVSLFVRLLVEITVEKFSMSDIRCQPLREAVSWNMTCDTLYLTTRSSVSSWGCKLKYEQSYGYKFRITGNCRENFAWKNSVNGIVQCLRPVRNDHGFVALLYGSGHRSCLLLPRHGRTTAMKYVRNRCRW